MMNGKNGKTIHLMMTEVKVGDYTMPETKDQEDRTTYKHLRDHRCKGCASFNNYACNSTSFIMIDGKILRCPCQTCIIKMVCLKACKEFTNYTKTSR